MLAILIVLVAGTWTSALRAQVPEPLAEIITEWEAAFNAGDGAAVAAIYTEDAVRLPPEGDLQRGREAIAADVANYAGISIELRVVGGLLDSSVATSWGLYQLTGTGEGGEAIEVSGRWMNALKKTREGWRIHRDIWNFGPDGN